MVRPAVAPAGGRQPIEGFPPDDRTAGGLRKNFSGKYLMHQRLRRSLHRVPVLFLLLAGALPLRAQLPECPPAELPLWEMTEDGRVVYLLGSIHMLQPDIYPLDDALYEAFDAAEIVAFELDFGKMDAAAPVMAQRGMYEGDRSLRDALPDTTWIELAARFLEVGVPADVVERFRPWMAALTLSSLVIHQGGYEAESGIDLHFYERARQADKEVVAFETMEEQVEIFDGLAPEGQVAFVQSTLEGLDQSLDQLDEMSALWKRGDAERLATILTESMVDQPELMERILYARNRAWVTEVEALLASRKTAIVIVGMGHMIGEGSLIELLRERGHAVRRWGAARCASGGGGHAPPLSPSPVTPGPTGRAPRCSRGCPTAPEEVPARSWPTGARGPTPPLAGA